MSFGFVPFWSRFVPSYDPSLWFLFCFGDPVWSPVTSFGLALGGDPPLLVLCLCSLSVFVPSLDTSDLVFPACFLLVPWFTPSPHLVGGDALLLCCFPYGVCSCTLCLCSWVLCGLNWGYLSFGFVLFSYVLCLRYLKSFGFLCLPCSGTTSLWRYLLVSPPCCTSLGGLEVLFNYFFPLAPTTYPPLSG